MNKYFVGYLPNLSSIGGSSSKLSTVEENRPPTIMVAIGPMISEPGLSLLNAMGNMASAVTRAVIRMDGRRSWAAKAIVS